MKEHNSYDDDYDFGDDDDFFNDLDNDGLKGEKDTTGYTKRGIHTRRFY